MRCLDLFSGVGGFALGFERAGIEPAAFCEVDLFCREWLAQQWPGIPIYPDVRALDGRTVGFVDVVCGGFPCQDISAAGSGAGLDGARSGLWFQMLRIVREVRPTWVVIENVPALRTRGADRIYSDMEEAGYTGWFFVVGADDVGAPQRRKRAWGIFRRMADADRDTIRVLEQRFARGRARDVRDSGQTVAREHGPQRVADPNYSGCAEPRGAGAVRATCAAAECGGVGLGDAHGVARDCGQPFEVGGAQGRATADGAGDAGGMADADGARPQGGALAGVDSRAAGEGSRGEQSKRQGAQCLADAHLEPRLERCQVDAQVRDERPEFARGGGETLADAEGRGQRADRRAPWGAGHVDERGADVADGDGGGCEGLGLEDRSGLECAPRDFIDRRRCARFDDRGHSGAGLGYALGERVEAWISAPSRGDGELAAAAVANYRGSRREWPAAPGQRQHEWEAPRTVTEFECELGVSADGIPRHMGAPLNRARLKAAGNSVIPAITEAIGRVLVRLTP